ncbi:MAG: lipoate--protein ligase family protein [Planctomycetes bacterium]|nr:lipoate--protein ligase family protein [Planctomycetota bacterium]
MTTWRRVDVEWPERPHFNLAYEEALALAVAKGQAPPTLRFWKNDRTIVLGRHQCAEIEVNFDACERRGVKVVRRFSGGGAVYHDQGNLNYTLVLARNTRSELVARHPGFALAGEAVVAGLRRLGVDAQFVPVNDISVGDRKISGLAGTLSREALLYHGCLLVSSDLAVLGEVLNVAPEKLESRAVRSVRKRVATLDELLGRAVGMDEVKDALTQGVSEVLGVEVEPGVALEWELEKARILWETRYTTDAWALGPCRRCPCRREPDPRFLKSIVSRE